MFYFGVDYYPEHWPEERWLEDARLMAEAGINIVRLAEFAWSILEPQPGRFDFDWLDRSLEILSQHGIRVILGTPTASPPPWVMAMLPGAYKVNANGQRLTYGNRREYCPTHAGYRERGRMITHAMADHYKNHPVVIGWQIDNELGGRCYCSNCRVSFQNWLGKRYGTLERLNSIWGTAFWSHVYTEWSQIPVPLETGGVPNPGLDLDYRRFMSDTFVNFQQEQVNILREICHSHFITHNFMGFGFDQINYFDLAKSLDFVSWDNYPRTSWHLLKDVDQAYIALGHDTTRGFKRKPFWLMEEQSGSGGWQNLGINPRPGEMRLWTYQAIAHGADGMVYFRWRTARYGTEQYWHGILHHHGQPGRRYEELKAIGSELKQTGARFLGAENRNVVAMVLSYDSRWAFQGQSNHLDFKYAALFTSYYKALHHRNVGVDIVSPNADLSQYRLVIAPSVYILSQEAADNLRQFVLNGGMLITTARTGVKDEANAVVNRYLPGLLADVCGVEVDEYDVLPADLTAQIELALPGLGTQAARARLWFEVLRPTTAQVVASYRSEYFSGRPAITLNNYGKGQSLYVGTLGDDGLHEILLGWVLDTIDIQSVLNAPPGIEITERWHRDQRILFLLNHTESAQEIPVNQPYVDLISGAVIKDLIKIAPLDVFVLAEQDIVTP
jgi:beta-galactosidase